jgi:hypothetical protein
LKRRKIIVKPKPQPLDPAREFSPNLQWYVLVVLPNREYHVAHWREGRGDMTLTPLETRVKLMDNQRGGKFALRTFYQVPVFPRLVMCGFSSPPNWLEVMDNYHIQGVLGFNGTPARMRKGEPERIRTTSEALRHIKEPKPLAVGEKARIVAPGLWVNHVVDIKALNGKKARIIQNWFGSERETEVEIKDLEAA